MTAARSRHAALSGSQTKAPGFAGGYLLIVLGSGLVAAGVVDSEGAAAGAGMMLIVSGVFLLRWRRLA